MKTLTLLVLLSLFCVNVLAFPQKSSNYHIVSGVIDTIMTDELSGYRQVIIDTKSEKIRFTLEPDSSLNVTTPDDTIHFLFESNKYISASNSKWVVEQKLNEHKQLVLESQDEKSSYSIFTIGLYLLMLMAIFIVSFIVGNIFSSK